MSLSARAKDLARRLAPPEAREAVRKLRKRLQGPQAFETELGAYRFVPEETPRPRLTLVLPSVSRKAAFGGVTTGVEAFRRIGAALSGSALGPVDLRVCTTTPDGPPADPLFEPAEGVALLPRRTKGAEIPTRPREVFLAYNWHVAANLAPLLADQAARSGRALPLLYLIQEYEPGFYPFSADDLLARWALAPGWPVHAIVNSSLLAGWLQAQGHVFEKTYVFEPVLAPALRPFLAEAGTAERARRILVYGRPAEARNCWPLLRRTLEVWAAAEPAQAAAFEVVSAGAAHPPATLPGGARVRPLGKLSLEDYARLLSTSAAGVSLMASPHPSYPPLEMAHFGLRTISNRYGPKDPSTLHDNLVTPADPRPESLAAALAEACRAFEADPAAGPRGASRLPGYLDGDPFPLAEAIAADLAPRLAP